MKTLTIGILAVLFSTINLKAENKAENTSKRVNTKEYVAFRLSSEDVTKNATNDMIAEIERKDVSKIAFRTNIQEVTANALGTDLEDLNRKCLISFKLDVENVFDNINKDQALYELAVAEVAFKLNIHQVMQNLANTDASALESQSQTIKFALDPKQVEKYAKSVNVNELETEEALYADIE